MASITSEEDSLTSWPSETAASARLSSSMYGQEPSTSTTQTLTATSLAPVRRILSPLKVPARLSTFRPLARRRHTASTIPPPPAPSRSRAETSSSADPSPLAGTSTSLNDIELLSLTQEIDAITATPIDSHLSQLSPPKVGRNYYINTNISIPTAIFYRFHTEIKPQLNRDLQTLAGIASSGKRNILSESNLYMITPTTRGKTSTSAAEAAVVISCSSKACKRLVEKWLVRGQLHYLRDFEHKVKVRYLAPPS